MVHCKSEQRKIWVNNRQSLDRSNETDCRTGIQLYIFWVSFISSFFLSTFGMIKFYKNGPSRFLPSGGRFNGFLSLKKMLTYLSILFMFVSKTLLLATLIYDRPMVKLIHSACRFGPDIGEVCPEAEFQIVPSGSSSTIIEFMGFLKISRNYRQFSNNVIGLDGTKSAKFFT